MERVIQGGLIHVVDIRNGLYILRYTGELADEIQAESFEEGNSNLRGARAQQENRAGRRQSFELWISCGARSGISRT